MAEKVNRVFQKNDGKNQRYFMIYNTDKLSDVLRRAKEEGTEIDGLLVEHKNWYISPDSVSFDPRLYCIVSDATGKYYAVSFKDYVRQDKISVYDSLPKDEFIETKIVPAEKLGDDFVLADIAGVMDSINPSEPINTHDLDPSFENHKSDEYHVYKYEINASFGLRLMIETARFYNRSIDKIAISTDEKMFEFLNTFYIKYFFSGVTKSKYVPRIVRSYSPFAGNLVMCAPHVAKEYEKHGYKIIDVSPRELTDLSKRRR